MSFYILLSSRSPGLKTENKRLRTAKENEKRVLKLQHPWGQEVDLQGSRRATRAPTTPLPHVCLLRSRWLLLFNSCPCSFREEERDRRGRVFFLLLLTPQNGRRQLRSSQPTCSSRWASVSPSPNGVSAPCMQPTACAQKVPERTQPASQGRRWAVFIFSTAWRLSQRNECLVRLECSLLFRVCALHV